MIQDKLEQNMMNGQTSLGGLRLSPGGRYAAWVANGPSAEQDKYLYYIHATDLEDSRMIPLTSGGEEKSFFWLDEATVVYPALKTEADKKAAAEGEPLTVFHRIPVIGGESRELFRLPLTGASVVDKCGDVLVLTALHDASLPEYRELDEEGKRAYKETIADRAKHMVADERAFRRDGQGYRNKMRSRLYTYHLKTQALTPVTEPLFGLTALGLCAGKTTLVYCGAVERVRQAPSHGVYLLDIATGKAETILADTGYHLTAAALYGGMIYLWGCKAPEELSMHYLRMLRLDPKAKAITPMPDWGMELGTHYTSDATRMGGTTLKAMDDGLYMMLNRRRDVRVYRFTGQGEPVAVTGPEIKVSFFDKLGDRLLCAGFDRLGLQEIMTAGVDGHTCLTDYNSVLTYTPSPPIDMSFTNSDGVEIDGWLVRPAGVQGKFPALLLIHGGPHSEYSDILLHDAQYMAARGYGVMLCNPRGSTGRGPDFADLRGRFGTIDYQDLMEFVDHVLEACPDIDRENVGVTGASYGGYMTNWIITQTDRFKAAVAQCSISNWWTMFYICDVPDFVAAEMGGTPVTNPEGYRRPSPIEYVDKVKTPTLFLQYDNDHRCPMDQALQMYSALVDRDVDTRLVILHGESHTLIMTGKPSSRMIRHREMMDWFDRYLKNAGK